MRILVVRLGRQREQRLRRRLAQSRRQRQFAAEPMHFLEVVLERQRRLRANRVAERLGVDEWVAIAIAADP